MRARKDQPPFSRRELRRRLAEAIALEPDAQYAIGGAEAMAAHGYWRFTNDVDVFVLERDRNRMMNALRRVGLEVFPVYAPFHYAAKLPGDPKPERRIDVLVPAAEPELSGIEYAVEAKLHGRTWRVFTAEILALAKFYAAEESGDARHKLDLLELYRRGIFDARKVRLMLESIDAEAVPSYDALILSFQPAAPRRRERPTKRLPPP